MARKIHEKFTFESFEVETPEGKVTIVSFTDSETNEVDEYVFPEDGAKKLGAVLSGSTLVPASASALDAIKGAPPPVKFQPPPRQR